jgi:hypothetical protein
MIVCVSEADLDDEKKTFSLLFAISPEKKRLLAIDWNQISIFIVLAFKLAARSMKM